MSPACSSISVPAAAYVSQDNENHRIRKINVKSGETSTLAGSSEGFKDGVGTSAQFSYPIGVAIDPEGAFVFVAVRMPVARIPASKSIFPQSDGTFRCLPHSPHARTDTLRRRFAPCSSCPCPVPLCVSGPQQQPHPEGRPSLIAAAVKSASRHPASRRESCRDTNPRATRDGSPPSGLG